MKPVLQFLAHSALGPGPAAQPVGPPWPGTRLRVTNASFGGGLMAPANLPVCSDFYPGCPGGKGVVTATFGHIQRNRCMLGAQPALLAHLAHGHQLQGTCHQNTVCSVKNKPSWAGQGRQVPERGGSHVQAALIPQRADLRGPQDGTAPKPCLLQRHSSSRGGSDSGAARGTQSHDTAVAEPSGGAGGTVEARGVRAKLGSGPRGGVIHPPPRRELAVSGLGLQGQPV